MYSRFFWVQQKFSLFFLIIIASENSQKLFLSFNQLISFDNIFQKHNISPFISVTGTMFAFFSILLLNFGDYARYAKDKNHLFKGNLSLILNLILFSFQYKLIGTRVKPSFLIFSCK